MADLRDFHTRNPLLDAGDPESFRHRLLDYFERTYDLFERLFDSFASDDTFYVQPEPLRHPHIFYFGHTGTFYINKLNVAGLIDFRIHPEYESMFAIGVDEMSWDDLNGAHYDWPSVREVRDYRIRAREVVRDVIRRLPITLPVKWTDPAWAVLMGIEHERIHLETSSVLIRQTKLKYLQDTGTPIHDFWRRCPEAGPAPANGLLPVPRGRVHLGKPRDHNLYGWDNEYGRHEADIDPFQASRFLVSNGEFLAFVEAGGYREPRWWTGEGRRWLDWRKPEHPIFWRRQPDGGWRYRALLEELDMPWDWPVDVNWLEAKAFCNWKAAATGLSIRLPTEDEWVRLLDHSGLEDEPYWGAAGTAPGNLNLEYWASSCPVDRFAFRDGFCDVVGNVWQWTETPIAGFEGFQVHPWYDDFSTPTFDDKHNLIKGGSWISTGNEANRHSRYAFRRHFFQHAGFRYVAAGPSPYAARVERSTENLYETDQQLAQYCEFHYGPEYLGVANFPKTCAGLCLRYMEGRPKKRALDIGCATGRSAFELARGFEFVHGVDFTARFIRLALALKEKGELAWEIATEGELSEGHGLRLADLGLAEAARRVEFWQGDAANLKPQFSGYDLIFAGNLIDRMVSPRAFLSQAHERLNAGGLLILTSPYTWLDDFTNREEWLGGFARDGRPVSSLDGLHAVLDKHFRLLDARDVPFVLRETARKFQHTLAQMTVWEKR
ncbi:MAG TPA: 5-histidylcysteine sulfoxide synthase [Thiobacillaceae bacterium]|nr:5-histidylcysteine sulfoxide synthase [Thiobacillaceae bacterium]